MVHNLRFLILRILIIIYYSPTLSVAVCPSNIKEELTRPSKCKKNVIQNAPPKMVKNQDPLEIIKDLFKTIKDDSYNHSYADMLEDVKAEHSIKYHKPNAPFFYSNDSFVMKDIIDLLLEDPDGYIDETKTKGVLKVYRDNNYHEEIEELFDREPLYRRDIPQPKKFQKDFLGQAHTGPTNRVMVTLKIKGDEQNEDTLEKRLAYIGNNILFIDAFPSKVPLPHPAQTVSVAQPVSGAPEGGNAEEGTPEEAKPEEAAPEAAAPEAAAPEAAAPEAAAPEAAAPEATAPAPEKTATKKARSKT